MSNFKPVTFSYNKAMEPYFKEGFNQFQKETMIHLDGIDYKVDGESLYITLITEQQEKWLFHLAFTIGVAYAKMSAAEKKRKPIKVYTVEELFDIDKDEDASEAVICLSELSQEQKDYLGVS